MACLPPAPFVPQRTSTKKSPSSAGQAPTHRRPVRRHLAGCPEGVSPWVRRARTPAEQPPGRRRYSTCLLIARDKTGKATEKDRWLLACIGVERTAQAFFDSLR